MKRYAVHVSGYVFVDCENVVQARKAAKECRLFGAKFRASNKLHNRDPICVNITLGDLKYGRPIRVPNV